MSSLPVPLSPVMRTPAFVGATFSISWKTFRIAADPPIISYFSSRSCETSASARRLFSWARTFATLTRTRSRLSGFSKKSLAPSLMACTASLTLACPLMTMIGVWRMTSSLRMRSMASSPLISGSFTSKIARSTGVSGLARMASACSAVSAPRTW